MRKIFTLKGLHYLVNVYLRACRFRLLNSNGTEKMSFRRLFRFLCLKEESYVNNEMNIRLNLTKWYNTETEMLARAAFSISVSKKRRIQRRLVVLLFKCSPRTHTCIPWCNNQVPPLPTPSTLPTPAFLTALKLQTLYFPVFRLPFTKLLSHTHRLLLSKGRVNRFEDNSGYSMSNWICLWRYCPLQGLLF